MASKNSIARALARASGATQYSTGEPCKYGHLAPRTTASGVCLACQRERSARDRETHPERVAAWEAANKDRRYEQSRRWHERNPDKVKAAVDRWRDANRERDRAQSRQWHADRRERSRELSREWRQKNPTRVRHHTALRRARCVAATVGDAAALAAFERYAATAPSIRCYWCGKQTAPGERQMDHVIPLSRGGAHAAGNLCVACEGCNRSKHARMPEQFAGQSELRLA